MWNWLKLFKKYNFFIVFLILSIFSLWLYIYNSEIHKGYFFQISSFITNPINSFSKEDVYKRQVQQRDDYIPDSSKWEWIVKNEKLNNKLIDDMKLGVSIVKYLKSNAITIVKDNQLLGMGCGQPSRVDSTRIAIEKAKTFGHDLSLIHIFV